MSRYWIGRSAGSWTTGLAAVLAVALVAGFTAAHQGVGAGSAPAPSTLAMGAGAASIARSSSQLQWSFRRDRRGTLEIQLDDLMTELGSSGRSTLDREALLELAKSALGTDEPVELMRLGDALAEIPRVRIVADGRSIVLGGRTLRLLARVAVGGGRGSVDELTVGELLDALPPVFLGPDGTLQTTDRRTQRALGAVFGSIQGLDHYRDPRFGQRQALRREYDGVVALVKEMRREGYSVDSNALYDEASRRLAASGTTDALPLLDGYLRLEAEYENAEMSGMSHADRIRFRWQARRWAFGDELASLLFTREEAVERYQIDKLALDSDGYSSPRDKARRLARLRQQLKVELASKGSYVSFPDESAVAQSRRESGQEGSKR